MEWNFCTRLKNWLWIVNTQYYRVVRYYNRDKTAFRLSQINVKLLQKLKLWISYSFILFFESSTGTWTTIWVTVISGSLEPQSNNIVDFVFIHSADSSVIQLMYTLDIHSHFNSCLLCILSGIFKSLYFIYLYFWGHKTPFSMVGVNIVVVWVRLVTLKN